MKSLHDWDSYYLELAFRSSLLSYAPDKKVGAIIVSKDNILAFSYNGTTPGSSNATVDAQGKTLPEVLHAEVGAIAKFARTGIPTAGATLYTTLSPCIDCAKMIYLAGVSRVVYMTAYKCDSGIKFLRQNNVLVNESLTHNNLIPLDQLRHTGLL
jgi:dCMP deaminase